MKSIYGLAASVAVIALLAGCTEPTGRAAVAPEAEVVAKVNDRAITQAQLDLYAQRRGEGAAREDMINDLISIELLAQAATADGVHRRPGIAAELASQRSYTLAQVIVRERLESMPVTDEAIEAEYDRFVTDELADELSASHILVEDEAEAQALIARLDGGADFAALARAHSTDSSAGEGGALGWFEPSAMVEPFAVAAATLDVGAHTAHPVRTQFGWHVIRLDGRRPATPPPLEAIRNEIRGYLQSKAIEAWVNELRGRATVSVAD